MILLISFKRTKLAPLSKGMEIWSNPPVKTLRDYRLFDVKNYMDIMTDASNPTLQFQETLPLTYQ